ncbi:MAG: CsbD family protein [Terracidiphilus sp.]
MNDDKIKGTLDDAAGRAKRQVGEWTGDTQTQAEGAAQQVKGKAEKAVGNVRDAIKNATDRSAEQDRDIDNDLNRENVRERK